MNRLSPLFPAIAAATVLGALLMFNLRAVDGSIPWRGMLILCAGYALLGSVLGVGLSILRMPRGRARAIALSAPALVYLAVMTPHVLRPALGHAARPMVLVSLAAISLAGYRILRREGRLPFQGPAGAFAAAALLPLGAVLIQTRWVLYLDASRTAPALLATMASFAWPVVAAFVADRLTRLARSAGWRGAAAVIMTVATAVLSLATPAQWTAPGRAGFAASAQAATDPGVSTTAGAARPDIIVISLDTVRRDRVSVYNGALHTTPNLEAFARDALRFENAISTSPWTLPSHGALFTGLYSSGLRGALGATPVNAYAMPADPPMLAEELHRQGYTTGAFVANSAYLNPVFGFGRGFDTYFYQEPATSRDPILYLLNMHFGAAFQRLRRTAGLNPVRLSGEMTRHAADWLDETVAGSGGQAPARPPYFLFMNLMDAHGVEYLPGARGGAFAHDRLPGLETLHRGMEKCIMERAELDSTSYARLVGWYDDEVRSLDRSLGWFFERLRDRGLLDRAIVVVWSDHGEMLGEHGSFGHRTALYDPLLRVPLLVRLPSTLPLPDGSRTGQVTAFVQSVDLHEFLQHAADGTQWADAAAAGEVLRILTDPAPDASRPWRGTPTDVLALAEVYRNPEDMSQFPALFDRDLKAIYVMDPSEGLLKFTWGSNGEHHLVQVAEHPRERVEVVSLRRDVWSRLEILLAGCDPALDAVRPGRASEPGADAASALRSLGYIQ